MADIEHIMVNGETYDVADSVARETADAAQETADTAQEAAETANTAAKTAQDTADEKLDKSGGDSADVITTFTSGDSTSPTAWEDVTAITTGETHKSLFNKLSTMAKNVRWLFSKLGTTDISSLGNGTVTGALSELNSAISCPQVSDPLAFAESCSSIGFYTCRFASGATNLPTSSSVWTYATGIVFVRSTNVRFIELYTYSGYTAKISMTSGTWGSWYVYTTALVDANTSVTDIFSRGQAIPANSDLNDYMDPGNYYVPSGDTGSTITNSPYTATSYQLIIIYLGVASRPLQIAFCNGSTSLIRYRQYTANGWTSWYRVTATEQS